MKLGVAWYPEQHPAERWPDDVRRMAEVGLELVRVGDFAWSSLEPERGRFAWDWLDRAIDLAAEAGLRVVLATPTAAPPIWLALERPEILSVAQDGTPRAYGTRRFTCPVQPAYRDESRRIVSALVERYGEHPAVTAWQLDNEPGHHGSVWCWCDACEAAFHDWLRERYGTIDRLNEAWGAVFWSGTYPSFDAVRLPRPSPARHSPALLMAHRRFASDQVIDAIAEQHAIVEAGAPGRSIFSNLPTREAYVDPRAVARLLGGAAIDLYPTGLGGPDEVALVLDLARAHTGRAWIMEHQPGPINWTPARDAVPPGAVRTWALGAALHGIEALLFFSWRPSRSGSEQYHAGLLRHDGSPDRALAEVADVAAALRTAARTRPELLDRPSPAVAVLWSMDDEWAIGLEPHRSGLTHRVLVGAAYAAVRRLGLEADVVAPEDDLTGYTAVIAPALQIATHERVGRLRAALNAGAIVAIGPRALVKDVEDCTVEAAHPAGLVELLGARVVDSHAAGPAVTVEPFGVTAGPWIEVTQAIATDGAADGRAPEVLARFGGRDFPAGLPAVVRCGALVHVGVSSPEAWAAVLELLLRDRLALTHVPAGTERFVRGAHSVALDYREMSVDGWPGLSDEVGLQGA